MYTFLVKESDDSVCGKPYALSDYQWQQYRKSGNKSAITEFGMKNCGVAHAVKAMLMAAQAHNPNGAYAVY